jgi:hypothetical protein
VGYSNNSVAPIYPSNLGYSPNYSQTSQGITTQQLLANGVSPQSLEVIDHFGADAPAVLNEYSCNLEDALIQSSGQLQESVGLLQELAAEHQAYESILTDPDTLADYTIEFFGPNGPYPVQEGNSDGGFYDAAGYYYDPQGYYDLDGTYYYDSFFNSSNPGFYGADGYYYDPQGYYDVDGTYYYDSYYNCYNPEIYNKTDYSYGNNYGATYDSGYNNGYLERPFLPIPPVPEGTVDSQSFWNNFGNVAERDPVNAWRYLSMAQQNPNVFRQKLLVME